MTDRYPYEEVHGSHNTVSGTVPSWPSVGSPQLGNERELPVYPPPALAAARTAGRPALLVQARPRAD